MARPYYPRKSFAKVLGNDQAMIIYLEWIETLERRLSTLEALVPNLAGGILLYENGDIFLMEDGSQLLLEAA